jgi:hypothetical protein
MSLTTKLIGRAIKLPPATHSDLRCQVDENPVRARRQ